jgi:hypothetical protein
MGGALLQFLPVDATASAVEAVNPNGLSRRFMPDHI